MVLFIASLSLVYFLRSVLTYPILTLNSNVCRQRGGDELTNLWTLYFLGPVERRVNSPGQLKEIHGHSYNMETAVSLLLLYNEMCMHGKLHLQYICRVTASFDNK